MASIFLIPRFWLDIVITSFVGDELWPVIKSVLLFELTELDTDASPLFFETNS